MKKQGLYDPALEHDSCGVGFVANIDGNRTHEIVQDGLQILNNLIHRGAIGGDAKTGDGCGILTQIPHTFFNKEAKKLNITLGEPETYGIGVCFLPQDEKLKLKSLKIVEDVIKSEGGNLLGFRDVPIQSDCLGHMALDVMPSFKQFFVTFKGLETDALERKLYISRKVMELHAKQAGLSLDNFYIPSLSCYTINYKGMFVAPQLTAFYPDLADKDFISCLALVHQRYSTNTFPSWYLAQPFRYIAHNGEINTLRGNENKMKARESTLISKLFGDDIKKLFPITTPDISDSAVFDNAYELLVLGGRSLAHSMMMMIPEPFGKKYHISEDKKAFYEYHTAIMEPWDGPASMAFTNGHQIGAILDRNGLRPSRYVVTKQGKIVLGSEVGMLDIKPIDVRKKGRLAPGKMILVDTKKKRILYDNEIKAQITRQKPYRRWLEENRIELKGLFQTSSPFKVDKESLRLRQNLYGYTLEELKMIIIPMATNSQEPIGSMGNDASLAVLSKNPILLYNYFKQLFAQVTNPPIDPYRESLVMSLMSYKKKKKNLLDETPMHCKQLKLMHPILSNDDMIKLKTISTTNLKTSVIPILFNIKDGKGALEKALDNICKHVEEEVDNGSSIIVLSDKDIDEEKVPVPALLATSCVHHYLIKKGKRQLTGLVIETGEAKDVMHFATLIGYGASAINPYMTFETLVSLHQTNNFPEELSLDDVFDNYITAVKKGLLKIFSKMGISTIRSYRGAQIFEAIGLNSELIDKYFPGTSSRIEGIGIDVIENEALNRHAITFGKYKKHDTSLESGGNYNFRKNSEKRLITADSIKFVHKAVRENDYTYFKKFTTEINDASKRLCTLRGLFKFKKCNNPVDISEVEPAENIVKRFVSSAMSFGSISKPAHESMAIGMNRLGAQSNSGEGGEQIERYLPLPNGDSRISKVKQIASGRFGVTSNYAVHAEELQIKMAQGAKPGEGGQLPGHKVNKVIASVRYSTPGVMLISPPPHHDIYSIEDLAQLIFDLKNANPKARVSVKLVSELGVGTVAAGVAKGKADMVLISGHDGGTGATPISSAKYAGAPWEIGLSETQQTLVLNGLRDKIRIQTDGKLMTGRDVVIGGLLGAEEFGFGTISLIVLGCVMMRKCHLNTCPVGIATQRGELIERFKGSPDHIENFMMFLAQEIREIMAELGIKKFDDLIGRSDLLEVNEAINHYKSKGLDFSKLLTPVKVPEGYASRCIKSQEHDYAFFIDDKLIEQAKPALENKEKVNIEMNVKNCNRTIGATLSSEVSIRYGEEGLPDDTINVNFKGTAGQSFGAFLAKGITFELEGDVNDYLGKAMSGGKIIVKPPQEATFRPHKNIITGNVNLFGATNGEVYIHGMAGERFAVRNSGVKAVVEGVGDHGCEYMTGGIVVVLGTTGINFAAGMSGGIAYVLDENQLFDTRCNLEMVDVEPVLKEDESILYGMIEKHAKYTQSKYAREILNDWTEMLPYFVKVMPLDYKKALEKIKNQESKVTETVTITEEVASNG